MGRKGKKFVEGLVYLGRILGPFRRKVVGWKLGETLEAELVETALNSALIMRKPDRGLYFHSDRGSQYQRASRLPLRTASTTSRDCFDPELRFLLVDIVAAVRVRDVVRLRH